MALNSSLNSIDSDVFYVEQSSSDQSVPRPNTPIVLNSTEISGDDSREMISISSIASPEPQIVTIDDDSNEPTMPYGFGQQLPIVPPSLSDLNLPPNPFNILAAMAIAHNTGDDNDGYSPQSPEQLPPSPISTPPMNISTISGLETPHTTTGDNTFYYSSDNDPRRIYLETSLNETFESNEPRRVYLISSPPSTPTPPPRKLKRKMNLGMSFPKEGGVSQHICEACGQTIPAVKDTPGPSSRN